VIKLWKVLQVGHASCPGQNFYDTNADAPSYCFSQPDCRLYECPTRYSV